MSRNDLPSEKASNFPGRLRETIQTMLGIRGDKLDRVVTLRDLQASKLVTLQPGAAVGSGPVSLLPGPNAVPPYEPDLTPPPAPDGFTATAAISHIFIEHAAPLYRQGNGHLRTRVYGVTVQPDDPLPTFSDAVEITQFTGTVHAHPSNPATAWRLWIKWESNDGVLSATPAGGTNGFSVSTGLVGSSELGEASVTAAKIASGAIDLGGSAVTGLLKNLNMAVISDPTKIADSLIGNTKLANLAVEASKIASGAVTLTKFASGIEPVSVVTGSLPTTKSTETVVFGGKLYRWSGTAYVSTVPTGDLTGTVSDAQIAGLAASKVTGQLTDAQLAGISAAKLTGQITSTQITDSAISTPKLAAGAITSNKIAANTITAANIAAGTITGAEILAGTITGAKIAAGTIQAGNIAAGTITASNIAANTITAAQIAAGAINASELAVGAVTAGKIATGAIIANDGVISNAAITNALIANAAIGSAQIADAAITSAKVGTAAIGAAAIQDLAVGNAKIGNLAVDDSKIANLSAAKITAGSIAVGQHIQSTGYIAGSAGWRINGGGTAEFSGVVVRGTVFATSGLIGGITIASNAVRAGQTAFNNGQGFHLGSDGRFSLGNSGGNRLTWDGTNLNVVGGGTFSGALSAATGTFNGNVSGGQFTTGSFTGYAWPPAPYAGTYLGPSGLLLGNFNNNSYFQVTASGDIYAPGFRVVDGTMTINQANVIKTLNIADQAVSVSNSSSGTNSASTDVTIPAGVTATVFAISVAGSTGESTTQYQATTHSLNIDGVVFSVVATAAQTRVASGQLSTTFFRGLATTVAGQATITGPAYVTVSTARNFGAGAAESPLQLIAFARWK